jgi:hypothetical protein
VRDITGNYLKLPVRALGIRMIPGAGMLIWVDVRTEGAWPTPAEGSDHDPDAPDLTEMQMDEALLAPFAVSQDVQEHDLADAGFACRDNSAFGDISQPVRLFVDPRQASPRDIAIGAACDSDTVCSIAVIGAAGDVMVDCRGDAACRDTSAIVESF